MTDWKKTFPWTAAVLRFLWPEGPARRKLRPSILGSLEAPTTFLFEVRHAARRSHTRNKTRPTRAARPDNPDAPRAPER